MLSPGLSPPGLLRSRSRSSNMHEHISARELLPAYASQSSESDSEDAWVTSSLGRRAVRAVALALVSFVLTEVGLQMYSGTMTTKRRRPYGTLDWKHDPLLEGQERFELLGVSGDEEGLLSPGGHVRATGTCLVAATGHDLDALTVAYFAVGRRTVGKAARSAWSAKRSSGREHVETLLVTDEPGASFVCDGAFDIVRSLGRVFPANVTVPEYAGSRAYSAASSEVLDIRPAGAKATASDEIVATLRSAKIRAVALALRLATAPVLVFLDCDTLVCQSLLPQACAVVSPQISNVAFVAVPREKWHATKQLKSLFKVSRGTPQAQTGALILYAHHNATRKLLDAWRRAYDELRSASPPQIMDQIAFRAALHVARTTYHVLDPTFLCRGSQETGARTNALGCDGLPPALLPEQGGLMSAIGMVAGSQSQQRQGSGGNLDSTLIARPDVKQIIGPSDGGQCDVLHSNDLTIARGPFRNASINPLDLEGVECVEFWIDVPFASGDDVQTRDGLRAAIKDARTNMIHDNDPHVTQGFECPFSRLVAVTPIREDEYALRNATRRLVEEPVVLRLAIDNVAAHIDHPRTNRLQKQQEQGISLRRLAAVPGDKIHQHDAAETGISLDHTALLVREPLERVLSEYSTCCQRSIGDAEPVEWCVESHADCPAMEPSIEGLGEAITQFAEARGNVFVKTLFAVLYGEQHQGDTLLYTSSPSDSFGCETPANHGPFAVSRADERVVAWRLTTELTLVGVAERPRETVEVALRGSSRRRKRRDVTTPPPRSPLRAELSDAHLARIRRAMALDRHVHKVATARFQGDLDALRNTYRSADDQRQTKSRLSSPSAGLAPQPNMAMSVQNYFRR